MSLLSGIKCSSGMKYDLSILIKTSLIDSYSVLKELQEKTRNNLILQNDYMKQKHLKENKKKGEKYVVIYNLKSKNKKELTLDLSQEKITPRGYFCYPIKGAYFQKSSYEMTYFPLLPFKLFKEGIDTFDGQKNLSETYLSYPCLPKKEYERIKMEILTRNNIANEINTINNNDNLPIRPANYISHTNKIFILWSFITILKGQIEIMGQDFHKIYETNKDEIIVSILKEISKYLKLDINILYHIINNFLSECEKKIWKDSLTNKGISYKKYDKYWCRICNRFFCAFHFKIKVKTKNLNNGNIRSTYEYPKKIQITLRPPEYLFKEQEESDNNKKELRKYLKNIISECDCECCYKVGMSENEEKKFDYDESQRFNKMKLVNKEDFFVLCKVVSTYYKLLTQYFKDYYSKYHIMNIFLSPCVFRKIMHDKYDCSLLKYLIRLIIENKYLKNINFFLSSKAFHPILYETLPEEDLFFFNNTLDNKIPEQIYNDKGEQKIVARERKKGTARQQIQSEKDLYYKPCDHYPDECTPENCKCAQNGTCLKYCSCFKEKFLGQLDNNCKYMFPGCQSHSTHSNAICSNCYCRKCNIECIPGICSCGEKCRNNNITLGKRKKLIYGYSYKIGGGGLFAGENISEGEFVDVYCGEMVEKDELDRLSVFYDQIGNNYPFSINKKFDYVAVKCGGLTRFINHGSYNEENIKADKIMVNGIPYIAFYANRNIKKYEELFYDYSYDENSMPKWMLEYNRRMDAKLKRQEENRMFQQNKYNKKQNNRKKRNMEKKNKDEDDEIFQTSSKSINLDEDMDD